MTQDTASDPPGTVKCKFCGATDVYWMTVLGRREAEFLAKNGTPLALKLAKARLFDVSGGEHVCPLSDDDFGVVK